ncbi:FecR domain-containing protein [Roseibium sp. Sym1]|uniref:FecR domain-containing protein n=1 Tax=Roseibium sp. Sym1 TaxID=3016006 RepID=UPI0022B363EF|nr:FecR domain-containing protein [Roseibium sp. Sym1]
METKAGETVAVKRGMTVRKGWKVRTGSGRVVIRRGGEKFVVSSGSVVTLEPKGFLVKRMVVYQDRGTLEVDVKRRWYRHFKVETPFLAALVKGTRFKVRVTQNTASVNVGRGVVGVHDFASGDRANIGAGQSAATHPGRSAGLKVRGKTKPDVVRGPKRAPAFKTRIAKNVPATAAQARSENANGNGSRAASNTSRGGGNGNGNSNGSSNGNGNGNGGSNGNGNGSSNGNGNGSSNGNGNGGSNGNGNGNSGGNGKNN